MPIQDPTDIPDCTVWLTAQAILGLNDGDRVVTWPDSSGNANDATTGAAESNRPVFKTNILNGLPAVRFASAAPETMDLPDLFFDDFDFFFLVKANPAGDYALVGRGSDASPQIRWGQGGANKLSTFDGANNPLSDVLGVAQTDWSILEFRRSGNTVQFYQDGTLYNSGTMNASGDSGRLINRLCRIANNLFMDGDLPEVALYSRALTTQERTDFIAWAQGEYGLGGGTPGTFSIDKAKALTGKASVVLTLTGTDTGWSGATDFTVSGVAGVSKVSQQVLSDTSATVTIETDGAATGTLTVSDGAADDTLEVVDTATTLQAGNTSDPATWDVADVPGPLNNAVINHAVTVDANLSCLAFTMNSQVTIADGIILKIGGNATQGNANLVLGGNSSLQLDTGASSNLVWTQGTASGQANCIIKSAGSGWTIEKLGGGTAYFEALGGLAEDTTFWEMAHAGTVSGIANQAGDCGIRINKGFASLGPVVFHDVAFDGCARLKFTINQCKSFDLTRCKWTNTVDAMCAELRCVPAVLGDAQVVECSFDKRVDVQSAGNLLWDTSFSPEFTPALTTGEVRNSLIVGVADGNDVVANYGNIRDCYLVHDHLTGNPHYVSHPVGLPVGPTKQYRRLIFDYPHPHALDSGDGILGNTNEQAVDAQECLSLPSVSDGLWAANVVTLGNPDQTYNSTLDHNTVCGKKATAARVTDAGYNGKYLEFGRSNLVYSPSSDVELRAAVISDYGVAAAADEADGAGCTNNAIFNPTQTARGNSAPGYDADFTLTGPPGANDLIDVDPQFVDYGRCLCRWAVMKGYVPPAAGDDPISGGWTAQEVRDALDAAYGAIANDPTLVSGDLIPWVRDGYRPQNEAYRTAAHDGTTIGAVQMTGDPPGPDPFEPGVLSFVSKTTTSVTVSWTAATGGVGSVSEQLQVSLAGQNNWSNVVGATSSPATAEGLEKATQYDFRVAYTDETPTTVHSEILTVTTSDDPPPPPVPGGGQRGFLLYSHYLPYL